MINFIAIWSITAIFLFMIYYIDRLDAKLTILNKYIEDYEEDLLECIDCLEGLKDANRFDKEAIRVIEHSLSKVRV